MKYITMKIIIIAFLIFLFLILIYNSRKKISSYLNKEIADISDLNYSNKEIEYLILKFEKLDSSELINLIQNEKITDNECRALRKVLNERNVIIPDNNNFS